MNKSCLTCKFFEHKNSFCRRFPPIVIVEEREFYNSKENYGNSTKTNKQVVLTKFPVIVKPEIDWCGEWQDGDSQENFI